MIYELTHFGAMGLANYGKRQTNATRSPTALYNVTHLF